MQIKTGAQVWALRNLLQENADATLEKLATAGYSFIEPAGFDVQNRTVQNFTPSKLKKLANAYGLDIVSGHFYFDLGNATIACEVASELGMKYIVHSYFKDQIDQNIESYQKAAEQLNRMGEVAKSYGLQLAYHNHAHEFENLNGKIPFDVLIENTVPDLVAFQPDLGWMIYADANPVDYFTKHPQRFPLWHLRDIDKTKQSTTIGNGLVAFKSIFTEKENAGLQYAIVEMASGTEDILSKMLISYRFINKDLC
ncbi:sugar phosphate isomerase/epimerase family protein [Niabella ginsengisoli]|uniref:Sugar phosphate isomerase/epimerase n=1 Tax=Niabella ginsengisoli TaxID=522298 RepID=A0ABS9SQD2_9BACT|nr:sugar phosphate isomerase/epimerase [Niabella ginsengisoli]MCH5600608.1 sugar phosphate isomerase/epimerase [Niabella ginsengisoli]